MSIKSDVIAMCVLGLLLSACGQGGGGGGDRTSGGPGAPHADVAEAPAAAAQSNVVPDDCNRRLSPAAAAAILGVNAVKENPYFGHVKQPPDNMDVLGCGYSEVSLDPAASFLSFTVFTPVAADIATVYAAMSKPAGVQTSDAHVGVASAGWVRPGVDPGQFAAHITFRTATNIFQVQVGGIKGSDASMAAAQKLAGEL